MRSREEYELKSIQEVEAKYFSKNSGWEMDKVTCLVEDLKQATVYQTLKAYEILRNWKL